MNKQSEKYHLSFSGEYLVAAEHQRREIHSSITYGNATKTDVIAFSDSDNRFFSIEVKSTAKQSWVVAGSIPTESNKPSVFVKIPSDHLQSPQLFILKQKAIRKMLIAEREEYQNSIKRNTDANLIQKEFIVLVQVMPNHLQIDGIQ